MADKLAQAVELAVSRALENHFPALREDVTRAVLAELEASPAHSRSGSGSAPEQSADLLAAISEIQSGATQKEILRALLNSVARYAGRSALFVIKSGIATGWQGRGFENNDEIKDFTLDLRAGIAAEAMQSRTACQGTSDEVDPRFMTHFRAPADKQVLLLPLLLKDKVAALVYADAGGNSGSQVETASLQLIVTATSAWLEVISLRKHALKDAVADFGERTEISMAPRSVQPSRDPFAASTPAHAANPVAAAPMAMAAAAPAGSVASVAPSPSAVPAPVQAQRAGLSAAGMSAEDQDIHRKAQRFARLLIDELKLYNQVKVIEGVRNHDIYDRLKEDIEKSRATYQKRYGSTVAGDTDYFSQELVHILADNDVSLLGVNYPR